jgi:hypothetical protein
MGDSVERAAAPCFLVGLQSGRLVLVDSLVAVPGGSSEGLLSLASDAEALMRGWIVNSTFSPALDSSVKTIGSPKCSAAVASDGPMCDQRATCEPVPTGGVQCSCIRARLRYKQGWAEDGRRCEQEDEVKAVLQSEWLSITVMRPGAVASQALSLIVEAHGEAELAVSSTS